jgi:hypothetical protein
LRANDRRDAWVIQPLKNNLLSDKELVHEHIVTLSDCGEKRETLRLTD